MSEPSKELDHWKKLEVREHPKGPLLEECQRLATFFKDYDKVLLTGEENNKPCFVIPEVYVWRKDSETGESYQHKAYFFIERKNRRQRHPPVYGYISAEPSSDSPGQKISIDTEYGILTDLDDNTDIEDKDLFGDLVSAAQLNLSQRLSNHKFHRERKRKKMLGWLAAFSVVGGGGLAANELYFEPRTEKKAHSERLRKAFDERDYKLPVEPNVIKATQVGLMPRREFNKIPDHRKGDNLHEARRFEINEYNCHEFTVPVAPNENVSLAIARDDRQKNRPLAISIDSNNSLHVCNLYGNGGSDGDTRKIAIQISR